MTLIIFGQITYDLLFLSLFIASILFFYKKEELLFSNDFYGKVWFFLVLQCNLFVWNVGVAVCLSKKKRNDYQCTTQHIITTKLLSWENCRKVYLQHKDPVKSCCLSVRVVLCCTLLVQETIWVFLCACAMSTLDLTTLRSVYCFLTIEIEYTSPTVSGMFCFLTYC